MATARQTAAKDSALLVTVDWARVWRIFSHHNETLLSCDWPLSLGRPPYRYSEKEYGINFGPARWWHDALRLLVRIACFLPASWPVQRNSVEVTPTSPSGGWRRIPSLFGMPIVLVVAVSAHNLVPRDGIISMGCEYYTNLKTVFPAVSVVFP